MFMLTSSLRAVDLASNLNRDLVVSSLGGLELRELKSFASFPFCFKEFWSPANAQAELVYTLQKVAESIHRILREDFVIFDKGESANSWRHTGRYLCMQPDAGLGIVEKLTPFSRELNREELNSKKLVSRLSKVVTGYIACLSGFSQERVKSSLDCLNRVCREGLHEGYDSEVATSFVKELSGFDDLMGFDVFAALWSRFSAEDHNRCLKSLYHYTVWSNSHDDRKWLLQACFTDVIAYDWIERVRKSCLPGSFVLTAKTPFELTQSVCPKDAFTSHPKILEIAPFANFIKLQKPEISFNSWNDMWARSGFSKESPQLHGLLDRLSYGLKNFKMPSWGVFYSDWGFQENVPVSNSEVAWVELDALIFDENIWRIARQNLSVYKYLIKQLGFRNCETFKTQIEEMVSIISGQEPKYMSEPYLKLYSHIQSVMALYKAQMEEWGWGSGLLFEESLRLAAACCRAGFTKRPFWPEASELISYAQSIAWTEYEMAQEEETVFSKEGYESDFQRRDVQEVGRLNTLEPSIDEVLPEDNSCSTAGAVVLLDR
jgi:hypothetical protein